MFPSAKVQYTARES